MHAHSTTRSERSTVIPSILPKNPFSAAELCSRLPACCTQVEVRADRLTPEKLTRFLREGGRDWIVTVRSAATGGCFRGSEEERAAILAAGLRAGARLADVEIDSGMLERLEREGFASDRFLLSWHGESRDLAGLQELLRRMRSFPAYGFKIVPRAERLEDLSQVRRLLSKSGSDRRPVTCFAAGSAGTLSRILAPSWGSAATYGAANPGEPTGPGQVAVLDLLELFAVDAIRPTTRMFGLLGSDLARSPSPAIHCAAMKQLGLDARYLPLETGRFSSVSLLADPEGPFRLEGFGVTRPFKEDAARFADRLDRDGTISSAVNTLVRRNGAWFGANTDARALRLFLERLGGCKGKAVHIVGSGGTARTAAAVFGSSGGRLRFYSRNRSTGEAAAMAFGCDWRPLDALGEERAQILVNATPVGGKGEEWVPVKALPTEALVDAAYSSTPTRLAEKALKRKLKLFDGPALMLEQAAGQFAVLTGTAPPRICMKQAMESWFSRSGA